MEHPVPELHGELDIATQKARPSAKAGLAIYDLRLSLGSDQSEPRLHLLFDAFS
jgi:hypothetical protein